MSNLFILIWSVLPGDLGRNTRPVAASEYWSCGGLRPYLIHRVFRGVLVARGNFDRDHNPTAIMGRAVDEGASLIVFPEGTRGLGGQVQPFKSGVFDLAQAHSKLEFVPVWIDNAYRVMPKGVLLPIPMLCSVAFGKPLLLEAGEEKPEFLDRLRQSLIELGNT